MSISLSFYLGSWNGVDNIKSDGDNFEFIDGSGPCENNAYRESEINFSCGTTTEITKASEPIVCFYIFDMTVNCNGA